MSEGSQHSSFAAVVVAAGRGTRAKQSVPKQFAIWRGKPVLRHSVEALALSGASLVVVAIPAGFEAEAREACAGLDGVSFVMGGETRQQSVMAALAALVSAGPELVLIHDAARADLPPEVVDRLLNALKGAEGAIPVLPVFDSLAVEECGMMQAAADRDTLRRVQTPQAFRFAAIDAAHRSWRGEPTAGDDAQVLMAAGGKVALVEGDERLKKLTTEGDFASKPAKIAGETRIGMGFDVHRLANGEELWLNGIKIDHNRGLSGHSDADVGLHAITDALLGAIAAGDIGKHFPPSDDRWKGAASSAFVRHAASLVRQAGFEIANVDCTLICEAPKIGPHVLAMRKAVAEMLGVGIDRVSIKATTTERLGLTGRGEGIAAQAVASVYRAV
ncbi:bifunctional 2-C-methyl-D-erythritol 4-phosphate cytidylyltransferase/2-C-methyl-D-erythritol 2,4-cyclodiphosphate synthase [Qipengyuania atrilutea]|uniref:Bifunctional enzyme IspD/IspF n=1 Tax=Qipengyuania atrilutea TaxID=2744473 RepID=A0A850H416_9SPHN|nr:bifunctional 2-C-methyl-D-erythritol 4-phosphate cytidylyltransferase/2-C-methyl-D-erythritol 2,4-cyclodiphosphate synthase [Actirhodobacter atriluteus]NVD43835.1 bifunctional 2-C-methyl-D-erythritol 4-phosphate cytidylyltransferase/2-C-methyl-D-erythritol 2,4-cyclodiphosphate synthase [Actirhodobacter atriluteus]